jgi:glucose dehydrogenase
VVGRSGKGRRAIRVLACLPPMLAGCADPPTPSPQVLGGEAVVDYLRGGDWPSHGRDAAGSRYSPLREIGPANVDELRQAWAYPLGNGESTHGSELTPLVVGGVLYATAADRVVALRGDTGEELWRHVTAREAPSQRGLGYWPGDGLLPGRLFVTVGRKLLALDAASGRPAMGFGMAGEIDLPAPYEGAPTVFEDRVIVGSQGRPGGLRAIDVRTGAVLWAFAADGLRLPAPYVTIDVDRGLLYAVVAGPEEDPYYGGLRTNDETLANAVVALDARSGEPRWHFQTIRHDVWDYDLLVPPALLDVTVGGVRVPALALIAPTGFLYLLNRATGAALHGIEDVSVPPSDVPGERAAPSQPIPAKPSPLARTTFAAEDIVSASDTTEQHAVACRSLRDRHGARNFGPFTPYAHRAAGAAARASVVFPSALEGAAFGGVAVDPRAGLAFVNTSSVGSLAWLEPNDPDPTAAQTGEGTRRAALPYRLVGAADRADARFVARAELPEAAAGLAADWPCNKPPWGELVAVTVGSGEVLWRVPLGITDQLPEARRHTGRPNAGGALSTAAGVVFIGASNDRRFRAFDGRTGRELWTTELPRSAHAAPIAYLGGDGKQYIAVVAAGALSIDEPGVGAADAQTLIAYALP